MVYIAVSMMTDLMNSTLTLGGHLMDIYNEARRAIFSSFESIVYTTVYIYIITDLSVDTVSPR